jgi:hypothetical protein
LTRMLQALTRHGERLFGDSSRRDGSKPRLTRSLGNADRTSGRAQMGKLEPIPCMPPADRPACDPTSAAAVVERVPLG